MDANASVDSLTTRFAVEAREAFQHHLQQLFQEEEDQHLSEPDASSHEVAPHPLPQTPSEEECATLLEQQASRHDWYAQGGEQQRQVRGLYRYYQRRADQRISTTDPDATPMRHGGGPVHLGYHTHYVVDGGKQRMILAALVTPAEVMENHNSQIYREAERWSHHWLFSPDECRHIHFRNFSRAKYVFCLI